jgi:hypothetical protein
MRIDCALLCDAVTIREGLLHILGGGITRLARPEFPAPLNVALAVRIMVHPTECDRDHTLQVRLVDADGHEVGRLDAGFAIREPGDARPGEELAIAIPVSVHALPLPTAGAFSFELLIDQMHQVSVPFVATHTEIAL